MKRLSSTFAIALGACTIAGATAFAATGADLIGVRKASFRQLGASFKAVRDGIAGNDLTKIRQASGQIAQAGRSIYSWFPRGSGPQAGVKTSIRPEVWAKPTEFRAAQDAFARESQSFQSVASGSDISAIRSAMRRLGATCKGCHDSFRVPD